MVYVAIHRHGAFDCIFLLKPADRDRDIVQYAESFTVISEGVVKTASQISGSPVLEREASRKNGAARAKPYSPDQFGRVGDFEAQDFNIGKRAGPEFVNIVAVMDQRHVFVRSGRGFNKVLGLHRALAQELVPDQPILDRGKHVIAEI